MAERESGLPEQLAETMANLAQFHREHEKFYSQAPLKRAQMIQAHSRALKALAAQWSEADPSDRPAASPFAGAEDLNPPGLVSESGILFMEGEGEPAEIGEMKRELESVASGSEETSAWLIKAMEASWEVAGGTIAFPELADVLGERHRIIANDWLAAQMDSLSGRLIRRALDLLEVIDFSPPALREDLAGPRQNPGYLYSASEMLDRSADLCAESSTLVHENERRWRLFSNRLSELRESGG